MDATANIMIADVIMPLAGAANIKKIDGKLAGDTTKSKFSQVLAQSVDDSSKSDKEITAKESPETVASQAEGWFSVMLMAQVLGNAPTIAADRTVTAQQGQAGIAGVEAANETAPGISPAGGMTHSAATAAIRANGNKGLFPEAATILDSKAQNAKGIPHISQNPTLLNQQKLQSPEVIQAVERPAQYSLNDNNGISTTASSQLKPENNAIDKVPFMAVKPMTQAAGGPAKEQPVAQVVQQPSPFVADAPAVYEESVQNEFSLLQADVTLAKDSVLRGTAQQVVVNSNMSNSFANSEVRINRTSSVTDQATAGESRMSSLVDDNLEIVFKPTTIANLQAQAVYQKHSEETTPVSVNSSGQKTASEILTAPLPQAVPLQQATQEQMSRTVNVSEAKPVIQVRTDAPQTQLLQAQTVEVPGAKSAGSNDAKRGENLSAISPAASVSSNISSHSTGEQSQSSLSMFSQPEKAAADKAPVTGNAENGLFASMMEKQAHAIQQPSGNVSIASNVVSNQDPYNVASQIVDQARMINSVDGSEMIIKLKPEHLGELTLKVGVENGVVSATFHSSNPEVRSAIEASLHQLKQEMVTQGVKLDFVAVLSGGAGQFFSNGQREANRQQVLKNQSRKAEQDEFSQTLQIANEVSYAVKATTGVDYRI